MGMLSTRGVKVEQIFKILEQPCVKMKVSLIQSFLSSGVSTWETE